MGKGLIRLAGIYCFRPESGPESSWWCHRYRGPPPLGSLIDQFLIGRSQDCSGLGHNFPLGRGRQLRPQVSLYPLQPVKGEPTAIPQQGDHAGRGGVILGRSRPGGRFGGEHLLPKDSQSGNFIARIRFLM